VRAQATREGTVILAQCSELPAQAQAISVDPRILSSRKTVFLVALLAVTFFCYWPTVALLGQSWISNSQYSHGGLVPCFALVLLWLRRGKLQGIEIGWHGWGIALLFVAGGLRLAAAYFYFDWLDAFSLLICLAGAVAFWGGRSALAWSWPAIAFLVFMIPLPYRFESALGLPLQRMATLASTYILQTVGIPALAEGNTILLSEVRMGIVEACSGLSMLLTFFALSTAVALLINKPLWEKACIVLSAVPIGIAANVIRISSTGVLHETVGHELADLVFHNLAGLLMMPLALGLLWLEMRFLSRLLVAPEPRSVSIPTPMNLRPRTFANLVAQPGKP
jgi:exosortase